MKTQFTYNFVDQPHIISRPARLWLAQYLRGCRLVMRDKTKSRLRLVRIAPHCYSVTFSGTDAQALIQAVQS